MKTMLKKFSAVFTVTVFICALLAVSSSAAVYAEKTGGGKAESVYVAGNPNLYPIEYFDSNTKSYKGLIPDMLKAVSEKTGIDFTYISASAENKQKSLFKNCQVELVTSIALDDSDFDDLEKVTVLTTEYNGNKIDYCIGFTDMITQAQKDAIISALSEITESQKSGSLVSNAQNDLVASQKQLAAVIIVAITAVLLIIAAVIAIIIKKKRKRSEIDRMIDVKTGVGNSDYYVYAFNNLISEQAKPLYCIAYIAFSTKELEEKKGNSSITEIEKYTATKLSNSLTSTDYLSRIGDGAFVMLFQAENESAADKRVGDLISGVNKYVSDFVNDAPSLFKGGYCRLCDNIGIDAETAVYYAKQGYYYADSKHIAYHIGAKEQIEANKTVRELTAQVDDALQKGEFQVYLQLFLDAKTNEFCGAEALSRWQNSQYGLLRPAEYIDVLSKTGKIVEHDYKIFEQVCSILQKWNKPPFDRLFVSCNFTRLSVSDPEFPNKLAEISKEYSFERSRLVVEITENSLNISNEVISENIKKLTQFGFKVAIDDMGTGFSSLADIYDNEIDIVKIERNFVSSCVTERRKQMLGNIISLVHNAGARVICEGIETAEQLEMLKCIDCDITQGFYNCRVLPLSECERFFLSNE